MGKWISVKEELPTDNRLKAIRYSDKDGNDIGIALSHYKEQYPHNKLGWNFEWGSSQGFKVTYWCSLPRK